MNESRAPHRETPDSVLKGILAAVASGLALDTACTNAGINRKTFYMYLRDDRQLVADYAEATKLQVHSRFSKE
ncbi:hypothetical protein AWB69_05969 [Caballeronia udeis]|uniref:TetR family transcriptional regulator n=1 Tax=Caballeronia udeis TaxID=1232866 RepID=A0A158IHQ0_9BURK|nr:hypothetical protein [Caballeronia udeis]SAL55621.1 hypothetical protein AWB69_05969 [Caballeronia udeis]